MLNIFLIEDNDITYTKIANKVMTHDSTNLVGEIIDPKETDFKKYIETIRKSPVDVFIVDWVLNFQKESYSPIDIFRELAKEGYDFLSKFWIFYSGPEGNKVSEFLQDYFPNPKYYCTPGKGNLEGPVTKSGRDHFKEVIEQALEFVEEQKVPAELKDLIIPEGKATIRGSDAEIYDFDNPKFTEGGNRVLILNPNLFICMTITHPFIIFLYLDEENRKLKKKLLRLNSSTTIVKDSLIREFVQSGRFFYYNPDFFDRDSNINPSIEFYINSKLDNIKSYYDIQGERYPCDLSKQINILSEHGIIINP